MENDLLRELYRKRAVEGARDLLQKADRQGLTQKKVAATRGGRTFQTTVYVRQGEKPTTGKIGGRSPEEREFVQGTKGFMDRVPVVGMIRKTEDNGWSVEYYLKKDGRLYSREFGPGGTAGAKVHPYQLMSADGDEAKKTFEGLRSQPEWKSVGTSLK